MTSQRKPQAFLLDGKPGPRKPAIEFVTGPVEHPLVVVPSTEPMRGRKRFRLLALLLSALTALIAMWAGLATTQLIESFFARSEWLGWTALGIACVAGLAALAIILREITGLLRLNSIEALQDKAAHAINLDDNAAAQQAMAELLSLYSGRSELRLGLSQLKSHAADIMDPQDRIKLAERLLLEPLDAEARKLVASRARRVALLTTVTPAAALDILFVAAQNFSMLRDIASLYGGKPATLATLRLARMVIAHLAVTGGLALSDNLLQHLLGKGLLGRISARFGEGAVNGILTARIGMAAISVCRPIPAGSSSTQSLASLIREVFTLPQEQGKDADQKPQS
jgi:putative membrane protein